MKKFDINKVYNAYISINAKQRKDLIRQLNSLDIPVTKIEVYYYPESPGIKHLFFQLKDSNKIIPYYLLPIKYLELIENEIFKYSSIYKE